MELCKQSVSENPGQVVQSGIDICCRNVRIFFLTQILYLSNLRAADTFLGEVNSIKIV